MPDSHEHLALGGFDPTWNQPCTTVQSQQLEWLARQPAACHDQAACCPCVHSLVLRRACQDMHPAFSCKSRAPSCISHASPPHAYGSLPGCFPYLPSIQRTSTQGRTWAGGGCCFAEGAFREGPLGWGAEASGTAGSEACRICSGACADGAGLGGSDGACAAGSARLGSCVAGTGSSGASAGRTSAGEAASSGGASSLQHMLC